MNRKKKNKPFDEFLLWHIAERLKGRPECPHSVRVESVMALLVELRECLGTVGILPVLRRLNPLIKGYTWFNQVSVSSSGLGAAQLAVQDDLSEGDFWERGAVRVLLELAQRPDGLSRIKRCETCKKWIFAERNRKQRFCLEGACRQKHYDSDPVVRAKKLEGMRKRYADDKERAKNPKNAVGLRTKAISAKGGNRSPHLKIH